MSEETVKAEGTATAAESAGLSDVRLATSETPTAPPQQSAIPKRHLRKTRIGQVVSNKMEKTIVVAVVRRVPHAKSTPVVDIGRKTPPPRCLACAGRRERYLCVGREATPRGPRLAPERERSGLSFRYETEKVA